MADIHHVISLGIGSPADIPHFVLFGLSPNPAVASTPDDVDFTVGGMQSAGMTNTGMRSAGLLNVGMDS